MGVEGVSVEDTPDAPDYSELRSIVKEIVAEETRVLREELAEERERRMYLERVVAEAHREHDQEINKTQTWHFELEDIVLGEEYGTSYASQTARDRGGVLDRIDTLERGEVDPGELVASTATIEMQDLIPLHQKYLIATNKEPNEHGLRENQEIAARLFPYIADYAHQHEGRMLLPSSKVEDIIKQEICTPELARRLDVKDPNPATKSRVMKFVDQFGGDIFELDTSQKMNRLVFDRGDWVEYTEMVSDAALKNDGAYTVVNTAEGEGVN